ncbi:Delta lysin family [Staphylococcus condimenti]|nr:Delta lysin family [Staphylococcus condimenti]
MYHRDVIKIKQDFLLTDIFNYVLTSRSRGGVEMTGNIVDTVKSFVNLILDTVKKYAK